MDTFLIVAVSFWALNLILDTITFGLLGYVIFKILKGNDRHWHIGALIASLLFLSLNYLTSYIVKGLDISIGNEAILRFLNYDIEKVFEIKTSDIIIIFVQMFAGFKIGQVIVKKILKLAN